MDVEVAGARRNLILTCIGFIIYKLGHGEINDEIRLPIGFTLNDPHVLKWGAWVLLAWVAWRHFQYNFSPWMKLAEDFHCTMPIKKKDKEEIIQLAYKSGRTSLGKESFQKVTDWMPVSGYKFGTTGSLLKWRLSFQGYIIKGGSKTTSNDLIINQSLEFGHAFALKIKLKRLIPYIYRNPKFAELAFPNLLLFLTISLYLYKPMLLILKAIIISTANRNGIP